MNWLAGTFIFSSVIFSSLMVPVHILSASSDFWIIYYMLMLAYVNSFLYHG
jgi:hypothetical protein